MGKVGAALLTVALVIGFAVLVRVAASEDEQGGNSSEPSQSRDAGDSSGRSSGGSFARVVPSAATPARVVSHVDGDTVHLAARADSAGLRAGEDTTVRLLEIDTPEHGRSGTPEECFADEASAALQGMLPIGAEVWVLPDRDLIDPYGRTLLYLWTGTGEFVNLELVRLGYARAVLYEPNDAYIDQLRDAEERARAKGRGLWSACEG